MIICESCKQQFNIYDDFQIHCDNTGHTMFIEVDETESEKTIKLISKAIDDLVKKGHYRYDNDENGNLVIKRNYKHYDKKD